VAARPKAIERAISARRSPLVTRRKLARVGARLHNVRLAVMMFDGSSRRAEATSSRWKPPPTALRSTRALGGELEDATVATALLTDRAELGLDPKQGVPFVVDGAKALRKEIREVISWVPVGAEPATRSEECSTTCRSATDQAAACMA